MIRLHGSMTAIITPFRDGQIDWPSFDRFVEWQIESGTHALVACGTTGETPTLSHDEHRRILERAAAVVKGRVPLIAGTGSNDTRKTIDMTRYAETIGADAALVVTPYYNKPTQEGLYQHYKAVASSTRLPVIVYNVPSRCVTDILPETIARARAACPNIIGVKDATNDRTRVRRTAEACGNDFIQLSGEDASAALFLQEGGHGCVSVTANAAPAALACFHNAWAAGDKDTFEAIGRKLAPLHRALFVETSPSPIKYACSRLGLCTDEVRLPLVRASAEARRAVDDALDSVGLLNDTVNAKAHAHA